MFLVSLRHSTGEDHCLERSPVWAMEMASGYSIRLAED